MTRRYNDALHLASRVTLLHRVRVHGLMASTGVWGSQMPLLFYIEKHPGCTQTDIAEHLGVSSPSIATSIKRLQKAGMLQKSTDAEDMRCNHICLTPQGAQTVAAGRTCYDSVTEQMFRGFRPGEVDSLTQLLARLEQNLSGEEYQHKTMYSLVAAANHLEKHSREEAAEP